MDKIEAELKFKLANNIIDAPVSEEEMRGLKPKQAYKETRRDIREREKHLAWVQKVSEASGMDFHETTDNNLTPEEMGEAMLQI